MKDKVLQAGDVVQIDPATTQRGGFFGGCFMLVTEVKSWGAQGFICMPQERGEPPGLAYARCKYEDMVYVGKAVWVPAPPPQEAP